MVFYRLSADSAAPFCPGGHDAKCCHCLALEVEMQYPLHLPGSQVATENFSNPILDKEAHSFSWGFLADLYALGSQQMWGPSYAMWWQYYGEWPLPENIILSHYKFFKQIARCSFPFLTCAWHGYFHNTNDRRGGYFLNPLQLRAQELLGWFTKFRRCLIDQETLSKESKCRRPVPSGHQWRHRSDQSKKCLTIRRVLFCRAIQLYRLEISQ